MQEHDATETAWQNGYKAGLEAGKRASLREGTWVYKRVSGTCGCSRCGEETVPDRDLGLPPYCQWCGAALKAPEW